MRMHKRKKDRKYFTKYAVWFFTLLMGVAPAMPALGATYETDTFLSKIDGGDGKRAVNAYLDEPMGMDLSGNDTIFLVDTTNNCVEKITKKARKLKNVAGTHEYGYVDGKNANAQFAAPEDLTVRGAKGKQIFVADTGNNVIRKIGKKKVSTFLTGLKAPKGVHLYQNTLFISDTGNNQILGIDRSGGSTTTFATGLDQPTKLLYWPQAESIVFVNYGEGAVRAINTNTGNVSDPLIDDLEDIGGIFLKGRSLYISASTSIGVFNDIWKVRLAKPKTKSGSKTMSSSGLTDDVEAISEELLTHDREVESLNWPSDIAVRTDTITWEEYYSWDENLLYEDANENDAVVTATSTKRSKRIALNNTDNATRSLTKKKKTASSKAVNLEFRKKGKKAWKDTWYMPLNTKKEWQSEQFILKSGYQGDEPYFRVRLQYNDTDLTGDERDESLDANQSDWAKTPVIKTIGSVPEAPTGLGTSVLKPRQATLDWDAVTGASYYNLQFYKGSTRLLSKKNLTKTEWAVPQIYLKSNKGYSFVVKACDTEDECSDWSTEYEFRTPPAKVNGFKEIIPVRGKNIQKLANGDFRVDLKFQIPDQNQANLRAKVELLSKKTIHKKKITIDRLYVLYKGGSSILTWRMDGNRPTKYAGKHRFQDDYGKKKDALVGRPKSIVISDDGKKMYISQNNKITKYNFSKKQLTELAGHLMDSYKEGVGSEVRFSDVVDMALSSNGKWIYLVDRNNHRIRKLNTKTGRTFYITGAGAVNYAFESTESNGYQEGGACEDETDAAVSGCAYFNRPTGIALSPDETTLYIAEGSNHRIRGVNIATGATWLIAGSGVAGFDDGTGGAATFNGPYTLDVNSAGTKLYVADKYNHAVREIDLATNGVTTLFGRGTIGYREGSFEDAVLAIPEYIREEDGVLYWTEAGTQRIRAASLSSRTTWAVSGNGNKGYVDGAGIDAEWNNPKGFEFRGSQMFVADYYNDLIRSIQF